MIKPRGNTFDLSHSKKMSLNAGELVPIMLMECLPGDVHNMQTSMMLRFAPLVAPVMHKVTAHTHFFYVPNRIIWPGFEDFITGGREGTDVTVPPTVTLKLGNSTFFPTGCLADYLGLPVGTADPTAEVAISALPAAAIAKIFNEYYRDQNLIPPILDECIDGDNSATALSSYYADVNFKRAWYHDYFTSCLPWTQKGPEATIPLGTEAPLTFDASLGTTQIMDANPDVPYPTAESINTLPNQGTGGTDTYPSGATDGVMNFDVSPNHVADLSSATAAGIIDLRNAFSLQEWLEKNARGGSRYVESILAHFGVRSSDARLQRPEFLGGSSQPVTFSEVLQTSSTDGTTPQANMAGHGVSVGQNGRIKYRCEEHGWIIGFVSIMPTPEYFQGIHRHWFRNNKFDYAWPEFAHIGDEEVYNLELYQQGDPADDETFGYISRYASYKYIPSTVHGEFRTTLDFWHWARKFATPPALNPDFILCDPDTRIFANEEGEQLYLNVYHKINSYRLLPYFSNPKL